MSSESEITPYRTRNRVTDTVHLEASHFSTWDGVVCFSHFFNHKRACAHTYVHTDGGLYIDRFRSGDRSSPHNYIYTSHNKHTNKQTHTYMCVEACVLVVSVTLIVVVAIPGPDNVLYCWAKVCDTPARMGEYTSHRIQETCLCAVSCVVVCSE